MKKNIIDNKAAPYPALTTIHPNNIGPKIPENLSANSLNPKNCPNRNLGTNLIINGRGLYLCN